MFKVYEKGNNAGYAIYVKKLSRVDRISTFNKPIFLYFQEFKEKPSFH